MYHEDSSYIILMGNDQTSKRKKVYLINRDFQFRYAGAAVVVGLISTILTSLVILYPLYSFEILRIPRFLPLPILFVMLLAAVLNIFLVGFMGIFLTHRIAGPMYGIVRYIRQIEEGDLCGRVKTRDGDELGFVVRNLNAMLDSLCNKAENELQSIRALREELGQTLKLNDYPSLERRLDEMQSSLEASLGRGRDKENKSR